jgi:Flp pilus assembly protein TadG
MHITSAFRVGFDSIGVVWRRLARNTSGVSLVEFAVGFPLLLSTSLVAVDLMRSKQYEIRVRRSIS